MGGIKCAMSSRIARSLRSNPTDAEKALWRRLRARQLGGFRFRRQAPMGDHVVDFVCHECRLVVEVDGGQHTPVADRERTAWLEGIGYRVTRFWNNEVLQNIDGVLDRIAAASTPHPIPPPRRG